jgi:GNAT superfamily N-acetyltransferase
MRRVLEATPFGLELLPLMRSFDCGDEYWDREVANWINGTHPYGVAHAIRNYKRFETDVWLYSTEEDGIVGFGSLGKSKWHWPLPTDERVPINIIPAVALARQFHGKPAGDPGGRYSTQLLDHLIAQARKHTDRHPLLGLFVHPDNAKAIRAYRRVGFVDFPQRNHNEEIDVWYPGMILKLAGSGSA